MSDNEQQGNKFERKPNFESRIRLSKDGRFWIVELVQTVLFSTNYLDVIYKNNFKPSVQEPPAPLERKNKRKGKPDDNGNG